MNWYLKCLKQYADFSGRARRKEYWMFFLFNLIFGVVANVLDFALGVDGVFGLLYLLGLLIPGLAVTVRRLHDIDKSGWWIFIALIPLIGGIWLLVLVATDSSAGKNQYGENPKE
jgi:uncharacterized membrane protein YhaH (DUF805 family)